MWNTKAVETVDIQAAYAITNQVQQPPITVQATIKTNSVGSKYFLPLQAGPDQHSQLRGAPWRLPWAEPSPPRKRESSHVGSLYSKEHYIEKTCRVWSPQHHRETSPKTTHNIINHDSDELCRDTIPLCQREKPWVENLQGAEHTTSSRAEPDKHESYCKKAPTKSVGSRAPNTLSNQAQQTRTIE